MAPTAATLVAFLLLATAAWGASALSVFSQRRQQTATSGRGMFAPPLPGGRLMGSSPASAAFQTPWLPRPLRRQQQPSSSSSSRPRLTTTTMMSDKPGLLKNLQGLFKNTAMAGGKQQKVVRLPTIQEVQQAMYSPEGTPARLEELMQTDLPEHPGLKKGVLPNGLRYAILRNAAPPGRFDAFLEIFAGSADELESQQGMAHIVEHISYMGSRKRERLFGTG